jgi:chemotaxis regulatin CheY-phosphate phosphatase CheZ
MIDATAIDATVLIPYRYHATAGAFIEAAQRAQDAVTSGSRRQHIAVARVWYEMLEENLRALKREIAETRSWIGGHDAHPLLPQMRSHLSSLSGDARMLDAALTDLLMALSRADTACDE